MINVDIQKQLAIRIKEFRLKLGISQADAAIKADISLGAWHSFENCKRWPKPESISAIAKALEVAPVTLFSGIDAPGELNSEETKFPIDTRTVNDLFPDIPSHYLDQIAQFNWKDLKTETDLKILYAFAACLNTEQITMVNKLVYQNINHDLATNSALSLAAHILLLTGRFDGKEEAVVNIIKKLSITQDLKKIDAKISAQLDSQESTWLEALRDMPTPTIELDKKAK